MVKVLTSNQEIKVLILFVKNKLQIMILKNFKNRLENNEIDIVNSYKDLLIFYHLIYKGDYVATAFYELMKDKGY